MPLEAIPPEVLRFLAEHVRSMMGLELLLLLHADAQREWTAADLSRELRGELDWTRRELAEFARRGLVVAGAGDPATFRYAPRTSELAAAVARLAQIYPERRFSIIQFVYSAPSDPLRSFSEAFRLRKEPSDG